jgi:hypothetical protein
MASVIGSSATNSYASLFSGSAIPNWLADTFTAIQNEQNQGGLLGMLQSSGGDGSINSFLGVSTSIANNLATISQISVTNAGSLVAQIAANNIKQANAKKLQDSLDQLSAQQQMVAAKNVLDPVLYFANGSTLDTNSNILTMPDGTQYDTTTGAKYVNPASIIQMANGAYLNTQSNILTLPDGTQINTVTGLKVSVTA